MTLPDPNVTPLPPGWGGPTASTEPPTLLSAELFNRSYAPSTDAYLHVAALRAAPATLVVACAVIAATFGWLSWLTFSGIGAATPAEIATEAAPVGIAVGIGLGLLALLFPVFLGNLLVAAYTRRIWSNRQCIAFGRSGIPLRLQGAAIDVPWAEVTGIHALVPEASGVAARGRRRRVAALRVERGDERWDLNPAILAASPATVYAALVHYWLHPSARAQLGTVTADRQLATYAAALRAHTDSQRSQR